MPSNLVKTKEDEKHWDKAKAAAAKEGHAKDWAYITSIFETMSGKKKLQEAAKERQKNT